MDRDEFSASARSPSTGVKKRRTAAGDLAQRKRGDSVANNAVHPKTQHSTDHAWDWKVFLIDYQIQHHPLMLANMAYTWIVRDWGHGQAW